MKKNLNRPFVDLYGKEVLTDAGNVSMIGEYIASRLFGAASQQDQERALKAYKLARKIIENPSEVEMTSDEIQIIEEEMLKVLTIGAWGQVYDILER